MKKTYFFIVLVSVLFISMLTNTKIVNGEVSPSISSSQDERFVVQKTFWAFGGTYLIGSFSASSEDYIELNISSVNSDPHHPDDVYVVELDISSINHRTTYVSGTRFTQIIPLNYSDTYTITAEKHQFWSSVTISGDVTVHHHSVSLSPYTPSPFPTLKSTLTAPPYPSSSTNSNTSTPTPSIPKFSWLMILPLLFSAIVLIIIRRRRPSYVSG